ncbi:MAG: exodeoxyribonuclease V subunit alpha [Acidobacteriota bacterium]|nr:exodeoxyribonuclease V subunit alpha [Acidobacteriota bacterium]
MTEPNRPAANGQRAGNRTRTDLSRDASGAQVLNDLHELGHLADIDRHFAALIGELDGGGEPEVPLAAALASAWTRDGHACIALPEVAGREWPRAGAARLPDLDAWINALGASPMVARPGDAERRPLVLDGEGRLYLERLWTAERMVATGLLERADGADPDRGATSGKDGRREREEHRFGAVPASVPNGLDAALDRLFPGATADDRAHAAARTAVRRRLCVVSGGPGTGKTTIAAAIVALLVELRLAAPDRIALVAPTGKAATRLQEAVRGRHRVLVSAIPALEGYEARATTVHRWLFSRARDRFPVDALILDEGSMVDLTLMAKLLGALPDHARLVVLGDASQLASVQPGAVFADVCRAGTGTEGVVRDSLTGEATGTRVGAGRSSKGTAVGAVAGGRNGWTEAGGAAVQASSPLAPCVVELVHNWRFDEAGGIGRLAAAVVRGDASAALAALRDPSDDATELRPLADPGRFERLATMFAEERYAPALEAAQAVGAPGDAAVPLSSFRVLCAHRVGAYGAERFNRLVERRLQALGLAPADDPFYPGRPILVTRNDPRTGLSNGDTGIVLRDADDRTQVWFPELEDAEGRPRLVAPARLPPHESFFAVTVHRAQGSEYDEVAVILGPAESRVATRELLYTAVTRARRRVVVYGTAESVTGAVERATERASGLWEALVRLSNPGTTLQVDRTGTTRN